MFNCFISPFSWSYCANLKVIKVVSTSGLTSNVLKLLSIITGIV